MTTLKIDSLGCKDIFKRMKPFMSTEETRYYLCGIFIEFDGSELKATATNGHIMAHTNLPLQEVIGYEDGEACSGIIPANAIKHLIAIISKETGGLGALMTFEGEGRILFDFGDVQYRTRLIDYAYPDYKKVLPEGSAKLGEGINAKYLMAALNALGNSPVDILIDDMDNPASAPHLFSKAGGDAGEMKCVVMPMRV